MAEQLRIDVVADATEFKRELQGAERFARDTGKKIEADTLIKLRLNVLDVENKVGAVKKQLKDKNLSEPDAIRLRLDLQTYKSNLTEARRSLRNYINTGEADLSRFGRSFKLLGNKIVGFFKGAILFGGVAGALSAIGGFFRSGREDALAFESAFAGVKKTIDTSEEGFLLLNNQLEKLSLTIPVAFEELAKIAELGGQLGVSAGGIAQFTETVAKIAATTNLTSEEASTAFAKIANVLDVPIGKIEEMANVVVDLGNNFATTEKDIVNFTQRIASGGAVAGVASTDLFAIATAFSSVGIQAEAGGTAVNKAFLKINEAVAKGGEDLE
ncbi:MAG: phage tail tape measure protein [Vibrio cyclitrophicus]